MKILSHYSKPCRKLAVILVGLLLISVSPVWAQGKESTKTLIGLSRVNPENIQGSFTKDNMDQLNTKLFKRLDKNGDKAISAA